MKNTLPNHPTKRHPITGLPLQALGRGKRGLIWPIIGASEDGPDEAPDETPDDSNDDESEKDDKPEEHRQATREAAQFRRELKPWKQLSKDLGLTPEQVRDALAKKPAKEGDEPDPVDTDEIRRQARLEARQESDARLVRSEIRALAAQSFNNPADAIHNIDLSEYEVDEDGELVDAEQVKEDLAAVLKKNPHYAKGGKAPKADPSQGGKGDPQKPDPGPGISRLRQAYADLSQ